MLKGPRILTTTREIIIITSTGPIISRFENIKGPGNYSLGPRILTTSQRILTADVFIKQEGSINSNFSKNKLWLIINWIYF